MNASSEADTRWFTVEQANAMLPLVRAITEDLVRQARSFFEREQRLERLRGNRELSDGDPYAEELLAIEQELDRQRDTLKRYVDELHELGVELKSPTEGLVDFPSMRDGRRIYLCWKLGEPEVAFWHDLEAGFAGRQPIETATASNGNGTAG